MMRSVLLSTATALFLPISGWAQPKPVTVLNVTNGQQLLIEIDGQGRALRLACLQAPRPSQEPWSTRATTVMQRLVKRGDRGLFDLRARDVYGRLVGRLLMNGRDLGAELVKGGAVFAWNGFLGRCDDLDYSALESVAQRKRIGVWSLPGGVQRPWDAMEASGGGEP